MASVVDGVLPPFRPRKTSPGLIWDASTALWRASRPRAAALAFAFAFAMEAEEGKGTPLISDRPCW